MNWKRLPLMWLPVIRLFKLLKKLRPDILHTMIPVCNVMGALSAMPARVPVLVCSRLSLSHYRDSNPILAWLEDWTSRRFTLVHCKSEGIRDDVISCEPIEAERIRVIYNGLDTSRFLQPFNRAPLREELGIPESTPVIGMVANLRAYKGHLDLIKAAPSILESFPEARFLFIGRDDGMEADLRLEAINSGFADRLILAGERQNVPRLLQIMTILVSASYEEGFSNSILEAMASALPVVATRVGGNLEQVVDGITGCLVQPHQPEELAEAVLTLLNDPNQARVMGKKGRDRVIQKFSRDAMISRMEAFYREAIELAD